FRSPMVRAAAMAARSVTRTNSSERSSRCMLTVLPLGVGGQLHPAGTVLAIAEGVVCLHDLVDLPGSLVDDGRLRVPVEAAGRVLFRVAVAAVDLDAVRGRPLDLHGGEPLGQRGLTGVAPALVLEPARPQP